MLKVDVNQLLDVSKKIKVATDGFNELLSKAKNKHDSLYHKVRARSSVNFGSLSSMSTEKLSSSLSFVADTVKTLEEILGENVDQILSHQPPLTNEDYEHLIIKDYVNKNKDKIEQIGYTPMETRPDDSIYKYLYDMTYETGGNYAYDPKVIKYLEIGNFLDRFKSEKGVEFSFGLSEREVYDEFMILYKKRGTENVKIMYDKLIEFYPDNYGELGITLDSFNENGEAYYDYNGHKLLLRQIMQQNEFTNKIESIFNTFCFGNIINTLRKMDSKMPGYCDLIFNNTGEYPFVIDISETSGLIDYPDDNWDPIAFYSGFGGNPPVTGGYHLYLYSFLFGDFSYFANGEFTSDFDPALLESITIHEMAHAFDQALKGGYSGYSSRDVNYEEWQALFNMYNKDLWDVQSNHGIGYNNFESMAEKEKLKEFFAESLRAYFENPDGLREKCPKLYETIRRMLSK